jgi:PadR family transcriptional regulator PadR
MDQIKLSAYELQLLIAWEEIAKRGQLTTWIFLALKDGPKHMAEIKSFISSVTHDVIVADNQSMYRALRRYKDTAMISFVTQPGDGGGELKLYSLTSIGINVLSAFMKRTVVDIYYQDYVKKLIEEQDYGSQSAAN